MSTTAKSNDFIVLSDDEGQIYVIHRLQLNQHRIVGEREDFEKFLADNLAVNTTLDESKQAGVEAFRVLGVLSEDSLK
ncbi:hypothetical protein [Nostoc sp. FACHB-133]|uniref:hypothetical protein n=1 Tax=Nostoc sp. FACHB-133 TaxID=2692835 RepID=UPI00168611D5|nr:hypothetical protein [Nostoc sp. FACHB-133]MBD2526903.1 hypothetical protein [Nostoc sp. FACHB-133]